MAAQLIADSEAAAVQTAMIREYGNLSATNESLAKERDQLRAEVERLTAQRENLLKPMRDQAIARAESAEAEMTFQQERNSRLFEQRDAAVAAQEKAEADLAAAKLLLNEETDCAEAVEAAIVRQYARAERAEAEIKDRAAMMRDVMRERDAAEAELAAEREKLSTLREACGHISYIPRIQSALDKTAPAPAALT
jgi:chromosome segregation ATPase